VSIKKSPQAEKVYIIEHLNIKDLRLLMKAESTKIYTYYKHKMHARFSVGLHIKMTALSTNVNLLKGRISIMSRI
jgi:hypothetical protein